MDKINDKITEFVNKYGAEGAFLTVERDDGEYDHKEFSLNRLEEAREYRSKCSFQWMNHRDIMYIEKYDGCTHYCEQLI